MDDQADKRKQLAALFAKVQETFAELERIRAEQPKILEPIETAYKNFAGKPAEHAQDLFEFANDQGLDLFTAKKIGFVHG